MCSNTQCLLKLPSQCGSCHDTQFLLNSPSYFRIYPANVAIFTMPNFLWMYMFVYVFGQVDMTNRSTEVDLSNYVENGEWEVIEVRIERNVVYYACCKEPFPDVTFLIHIRRRLLYYMYNVIFPCVMMSALTVLVFILPPDSGEKLTMGITVLLAFSVFLLRMAEDLPETSEFIPLLSKCFDHQLQVLREYAVLQSERLRDVVEFRMSQKNNLRISENKR